MFWANRCQFVVSLACLAVRSGPSAKSSYPPGCRTSGAAARESSCSTGTRSCSGSLTTKNDRKEDESHESFPPWPHLLVVGLDGRRPILKVHRNRQSPPSRNH